MFIRQVKKKNAKKGKVFYQYQLVQASRIDGKVKQNQILYLGSDDELDNKDTRQEVLEQLQTKIFGQPSLLINDYSEISIKLAEQYYQKYLIKYDTLPVDNKIVIPTINKDVDFGYTGLSCPPKISHKITKRKDCVLRKTPDIPADVDPLIERFGGIFLC
jgi:hypothetical protein